MKILEAANYYGFVNMVDSYGEMVGKGLTKENVIDTLIIADKTPFLLFVLPFMLEI